MAEKQYFFKNAAGEYILGTNKKNAVPPGHYSRSVNEVGGVEMLALINMHDKDDIKYPVPASHYLKEDGTAYGSVDEIIAAVSGFFFSVAAEGGGGGSVASGYTPWVVPLVQVDGRLIFIAPDEVDLTKDTIVIEGKFTHTPSIDYTVTNAAGKGNFTFVVAPTEQLVIRYIKK